MKLKIFEKFLKLVQQQVVSENELKKFSDYIYNSMDNECQNDLCVHEEKIEIILNYLQKSLAKIKGKRKYKDTRIVVSEDFIKKLQNIIGLNKPFGKLDMEYLSNSKTSKLKITLDSVRSVLENIVIPIRMANTELVLENYISKNFSKVFGNEMVHRQYSIGGLLALKSDIDLGNGLIGVELKIADNLNATAMQRMIGQLVYYSNRYYKENLILFVSSKYPMSATMKELKEFVEELGVVVVYNQAIKI